MSDITGFLNDLQDIVNEDFVSIYIPSLKRNVDFKPLTVKQHKEILKNYLDGLVGNIKLGYVLNNIITENIVDKTIELELYDKNYILTKLRRQASGDNIVIDDKQYDISTITNLDKIEFKFDSKATGEYNGIVINLHPPSLKVDTAVSIACYNVITKAPFDEKKVTDYISTMLTYEIIKFISMVTVKSNTIDFTSLSIADRKQVVDSLPLVCHRQIVEYITQYREYEDSYYKFSDGTKLVVDGNFLTGA